MYVALVLPNTTILGEPTTWKVNLYDIDGDYVGQLGSIVRTPKGMRYKSYDGWQQDFDNIQDASYYFMGMVFDFDRKKMH